MEPERLELSSDGLKARHSTLSYGSILALQAGLAPAPHRLTAERASLSLLENGWVTRIRTLMVTGSEPVALPLCYDPFW